MMTIQVTATYVEPQGFNDKFHVYNFINYLFRTDKKQKWTNSLSTHNIFILDGILYPLETENEKSLAKEKTIEIIRPIIKNDFTKLGNDILYFDTYDNQKEVTIATFVEEDKTDFLVNLLTQFSEETRFNYLLSVVHFDQEESSSHIHSLFTI